MIIFIAVGALLIVASIIFGIWILILAIKIFVAILLAILAIWFLLWLLSLLL